MSGAKFPGAKTGRKPTGCARVQASCRIHPDALAAWRTAGGTNLSTDVAAAFEAKWLEPIDEAWLQEESQRRRGET